jgi:hypothetical protein
MGLSPLVWGKEAWHFIHLVALTYPTKPTQDDVREYNKFFESLGSVLPCEVCAHHYREKIKVNPPKLGSQKELFEWTVDIHNSVNKDNKKRIYSYHEAFEEVNKNLAEKGKIKPKPKEYSNYLVSGVSLSVSLITMITLFAYSIRKK